MNSHGPAYPVGQTIADRSWLFPGRQPGRTIATEAIRGVLVRDGIHPPSTPQRRHVRPHRTDTHPHPGRPVDISSEKLAAAGAKLAARDWSDYVANRATRR